MDLIALCDGMSSIKRDHCRLICVLFLYPVSREAILVERVRTW